MIAIVWSLLGAIAYGISDFIGASATRRSSAWPVAVITALSAALASGLLACFTSGHPSGAVLGWAVLAGVGGGMGSALLYRGLAAGRMGVVAPVSAVATAALPVLTSTISGEHPPLLAWVGIVAALPGIWLVSLEPGTRFGGPGLLDGLLAGVGFGVSFIGLGHVPQSAGWWPLTVTNLTGAATVVLVATALRQRAFTRQRGAYLGALGGLLSGTAMIAFILATSRGLVSISSVLMSLYPAVTIMLAVVLLHERVHRVQQLGFVLCVGAVALVAVSGRG